jgi:hypothetical protein
VDPIIGHAYRIRSRNLEIAVHVGNGAFVGIREKFGREFLFTEFPNTVRFVGEDLGQVPEGIVLSDHVSITDPVELARRELHGIAPWRLNETLFSWLKELEESVL